MTFCDWRRLGQLAEWALSVHHGEHVSDGAALDSYRAAVSWCTKVRVPCGRLPWLRGVTCRLLFVTGAALGNYRDWDLVAIATIYSVGRDRSTAPAMVCCAQ